VGILSALINTTPIVAMLIPAANELEQQSGVPARRVLLPVAHATTLAGSATMISTSSNLLIAGLAAPQGVDMSMFSFAPIAVPVALIGWLVLYFAAPLMLQGQPESDQRKLSWRAEIPVSSQANAIGPIAAQLGVSAASDFELVDIQRWGQSVDTHAAIADGDVLIYRATEAGVRMLWESPRFAQARQDLYKVSIATDEQATVRGLEENEDVVVIAAQTAHLLRDTPARPGDMCLVTARSTDALTENSLVGVWQKVAGKAPQTGKTWIALAILAAVIAAGSFGLAPVELTAVAGATMMVLTKVLTPRSAARALNWNILAIIAGSVGLGAIVVNSGLADDISHAILHLSNASTAAVVLAIAVGTTVADQRRDERCCRRHPHTGRTFRGDDQRAESCTRAGADRNVHLLHVPQPVQPSVEPDGDETRRLLRDDVRALRHPTHDRVGDRSGHRRLGPARTLIG